MAKEIFKFKVDLSGFEYFKSKMNTFGSQFSENLQKSVKSLESPLAKSANIMKKGFTQGLSLLSNMVYKAKLLYLTLLGASTVAFALTKGSIEKNKKSTMWGTNQASTEAIAFADKQTGLDISSSVSGVAGKSAMDWQTIQATTGVAKTDNALNDTLALMDTLAKTFKGVGAGDTSQIASLGATYQQALGALGFSAEEFRKLANSNLFDDWKKAYGEDYKRNTGKDYEALLKGEQALNSFLEKLKDTATSLAGLALPMLTKWLDSFGNTIVSLGNYFKSNKDLVGGLSALAKGLGDIVTHIGKISLDGLGMLGDIMKAFSTGNWLEFMNKYYQQENSAYNGKASSKVSWKEHILGAMGDLLAGNWQGVIKKLELIGEDLKNIAKQPAKVEGTIRVETPQGSTVQDISNFNRGY